MTHEKIELSNMVDDIISSYEKSIQNIDSIFDASPFLGELQESFIESKDKTEKITTGLRDFLAKNESLRRKDFDYMIHDILLLQDRREMEVKSLLRNFLGEQKKVALMVRENFGKLKDSLAKGEVQRLKQFQAMISEILRKQDERKNEISTKLKIYQNERQETAQRLKELLTKGSELRIKDLKLLLKEFTNQRQERKSS